MLKSLLARAGLIAALALPVAATAPAAQAAEGVEVPGQHWSFDGLFGTFDRAALQRGYQVYREVCATCHAMNLLAFRHLQDPHGPSFSEDMVKAFAAEATVMDGPNDQGEMFERSGVASDYFPSPFANEQAARYANGGAYPPDLSLMAKARAAGPDYIYALLTGYEEPPADFEMNEGMYYNHYFPGHQIAMAPPLFADGITYQDGTPATVDQMAHDVATFLMWAAEPNLEVRKQTGVKVILFLLVMTGVLYAAKRKIWADVH